MGVEGSSSVQLVELGAGELGEVRRSLGGGSRRAMRRGLAKISQPEVEVLVSGDFIKSVEELDPDSGPTVPNPRSVS